MKWTPLNQPMEPEDKAKAFMMSSEEEEVCKLSKRCKIVPKVVEVPVVPVVPVTDLLEES